MAPGPQPSGRARPHPDGYSEGVDTLVIAYVGRDLQFR